MSNAADVKRRVELILEQLDQLPTLSSVALRLLEVTSSDDSDADDVTELVSADPALSARILALCRRSHLGVSLEDADVAHAVKLLGFDEVRAAAASVQVFELLDGLSARGGEAHSATTDFKPADFWVHSIAVAILSEKLVRHSALHRSVRASDAFLGGLMHDLGQLALHTILPRSFDRACAASEREGCGIDAGCRRIIGVDTHTVGRHLAQHWQLPSRLVEVVWLNGSPDEAVGASAHAELIRAVSVADQLARRCLLTHAGHVIEDGDSFDHAAALGMAPGVLERASANIHQEVAVRAASLGLDGGADINILRHSIERATTLLDHLRRDRAEDRRAAHAHSKTLRAARELLEVATSGASLTTTMAGIAQSVTMAAGAPPLAILFVPAGGRGELYRFDGATAGHAPDQSTLADHDALVPTALLLEETPHLDLPPDAIGLRLICSDDVSATLILSPGSRGAFDDDESRELLRRLWGSAISCAAMRERMADIGHRLIETNRRLVAAQDSLAERRASGAIAEFACGAAHEMNNPLTVISARAQSIARRVGDAAMQDSVGEIIRQAHKLSDLITSLKLAARAPEPAPTEAPVAAILGDAIDLLRQRGDGQPSIQLAIDESLPPVRADRAQIAQALRELLQNAQEAHPGGEIVIHAQTGGEDGRLMISVTDAGPGFSQRALKHAFDPFFSEKPAGRQPGLGLTRARRLVEANGGRVTVRNSPGGGAVATIFLGSTRAEVQGDRKAA